MQSKWVSTFLMLLVTLALFSGSTYARSTDYAESWQPTNSETAPTGRYGHTSIWIGEEMIIWGGYYHIDNFLNDGGRYNPETDTWISISTDNSPIGRLRHTAVWTGNEMIVWGGESSGFGATTNTGGIYYPSTDTWTTISTENAPSAREMHSAIWTGEDMIIWGGCKSIDCSEKFNDGGRYNPDTDTWTPISSSPALAARHFHQAFWTGDKMLIWGGTNEYQGAIYEPSTGIWSFMSVTNAPTPTFQGSGVWTGIEMVVWGGCTIWSTYPCPTYVNSGGIYNPDTNKWRPITSMSAPDARWTHTAIWTGKEMVVWGGCGDSCYDTGGKYHPLFDTWRPLSTDNSPIPRANHKAVWTGESMIIWGGCNVGGCGNVTYYNTGGLISITLPVEMEIFLPLVTK